jgi:PAS domain S-box-containing protein
MIDKSPIGVSITDLNGKFIEVNPAVCNMIGYSSEEMQHKHFNQFSHPDDEAQNKELYEDLSDGKIRYFELDKRYIHKNGSVVYVHIRSQIVRDERGKPLFEMAITENVTERKQAEEQMKKRMNELEIFNEASVNREVTINELRKEINESLKQIGKEPKYDIVY